METRERNQIVWRFMLLPLIFLTVALLGGLRVGVEKQNFIFIAPPLVCLVLAAMLMLLFVRGRLIFLGDWVNGDFPLVTNFSHVLTLAALFFASAQALNSVLPESGLLFWLFTLFFLWTLWNNLFSEFDAKRLLRSLAVLFGTAFLLKHLIFAAASAPAESSWRKIVDLILSESGISFSAMLGVSNFAPLTGYLSFFTLALYVAGLAGLLPRFEAAQIAEKKSQVELLTAEINRLEPSEQDSLRLQLTRQQIDAEIVPIEMEKE